MVCKKGTGGHGLKAAGETGNAEETPGKLERLGRQMWHGF